MIERLSDGLISLGLACVAFVAWLVRLESAQKRNDEALARVQSQLNQHEETHVEIRDRLMEIREATAQIKGYLSMQDRK